MGGSGRREQQLLAAVRPPRRQPALEAGHPARSRRQRRPGPGRRRRVADHRVPAQPVPDLHPAHRHPQRRPGLVIGRPPRRGPGRRPRRPGRGTGHRPPARPAHRRHGRARRTRLHQLDDPHHPAIPRRDTRRPPLRAADPHRCRVHPGGHTAARRHLQPPRNRGHLRRRRRNLARSRTRAACRPGQPASPGAPADQHGQQHHRAARRGHRASLHAARRLVRGQRQPLGPVTPAPAERRDAELGILRARRHRRDRADRQPRPDRDRPRSLVADPARAAHQAPPRWPPVPPARSTRWPSTAPRMTVWQLPPGSAAWAKAQAINVPIQFGSSS